jgi:hypothetical protein
MNSNWTPPLRIPMNDLRSGKNSNQEGYQLNEVQCHLFARMIELKEKRSLLYTDAPVPCMLDGAYAGPRSLFPSTASSTVAQ